MDINPVLLASYINISTAVIYVAAILFVGYHARKILHHIERWLSVSIAKNVSSMVVKNLEQAPQYRYDSFQSKKQRAVAQLSSICSYLDIEGIDVHMLIEQAVYDLREDNGTQLIPVDSQES